MNKKLKYIRLLLLLIIFCIFLSCSEDIPVNTNDYTELSPGEAGINQSINVFDTVYLNGSNGKTSNDVEYIWSFALKPSGSKATLSDTSISNPTFYADKIGLYALELILKQGEKYSVPDYVLIQARFQKSSHYFPNTVGNEWHYEVKNSSGNIINTFRVEIVGSTIMPDEKPANIWIYDSENRFFYFDTLYVTDQNDTVQFYRWTSKLPHLWSYYIIPFTVHNSSYVYSKDSISIQAGTFEVGYQVLNYYPFGYAWFVPNIGFVKSHVFSGGPIAQNEEYWELIYYDLVE